MTSPSAGPLPSADHTLFRGYGPFVALVALVLAMAFLAPTIAPERDVTTRPTPPADNLRSSGTGGVPQERRSEVGAAAAEEIVRSSGTGGVPQERRGEVGAAGAADNLRSSGTGGVPQERRSEGGAAVADDRRSSATDGCCR